MGYLLKHPATKALCISKILNSKRMLADHIEALEICLKLQHDINIGQKSVLPRKAVCAGAILILAGYLLTILFLRFSPAFKTKQWQMVVSAASALLFGVIATGDIIHYRALAKITSLIQSIETYDHTMKKMLMLSYEMIFGNQTLFIANVSVSEKLMLQMCTGNCIKAIYDIYGFVTVLEKKTKLREEYYQFYDPLETLESCNIFKQEIPNLSMAKELYNIFLYMQSHCLLRLSLAIVSDAKMGDVKVETNRLISCLTSHTDELIKQMALTRISHQGDVLPAANVKDTSLKQLLAVKHQSVELSVKLTANVQQMILVDENIQRLVTPETWQGRSQLQHTARNLATVQSYFLTRMEECERLLIMVKKLLNQSENAKQNEPEPEKEPAQERAFEEPHSEAQNSAHEPKDEFFINTGAEGEEEAHDSAAALQVEEDEISKRLMKKQFKPILQQLRERLVPVEESFKERERVALELKGIKLQDEEESHGGLNVTSKQDTLDTDDESDWEEMEAISKSKNQNKYKADRDFLAGKQQISLLASLPKGVQMDETILE
ncbi:uncharacterized protein LOC128714348 [Anopheles marshallii]|uniref:uncharacterized protein LOC128714348 n=1 Tax=Anopheles marshallii TaxID=1521116 RepID=UPI00237B61D8|nr:uncharacterized protein LOC128714348 [Anopheles marshallii]